MPDELQEQVPVIREVLKAMNIPLMMEEGYEADDLLGTMSVLGEQAGFEVKIVSWRSRSFTACDKESADSYSKDKQGWNGC